MDDDDKKIIDYCKHCDARVHFVPIYCHEWEANDGCDEEYTLAECALCHEPALFYREDMALFEAQDMGEPEHYLVYPAPDKERIISFHIPDQIAESYSEAVGAEKEKLWMSAAVMIGRTIEAVCKDFCPKCQSIFDGLEEMHQDGLLSKQMLEWAHDLRLLRNIAAHASNKKVEEWDIDVSLDYLKALLTMLYDINHRFTIYKKAKSEHEANKELQGTPGDNAPSAPEL